MGSIPDRTNGHGFVAQLQMTLGGVIECGSIRTVSEVKVFVLIPGQVPVTNDALDLLMFGKELDALDVFGFSSSFWPA